MTIPTAHPCIFLTAEKWNSLRAEIQADPLRARLLGHLRRRARRLLPVEPLRYEKTGLRLLAISRDAVDRILLWSLLATLDGDETYARRAEAEMLNLAAFPDWNPDHFLDTAEMTFALAVGYDWLYEQLSPEARVWISQAILEKGLLASLNFPATLPTGQPGDWWVASTNNWTQVCHGGLAIGALAVARDFPDIAPRIVERAVANLPRPASFYEPDGVYPEGATYWGYGTTYQVLLMAALRSAVGSDLGLSQSPGLFKSILYLTEVTGPTGLSFNYSDGSPHLPVEAAFFWLAAHSDWPGAAQRERAKLEAALRASEDQGEDYSSGRFDVPLLLWMTAPNGQEPPLPLSWHGRSGTPVTIHRSGWEPPATFVGLKGGRPNGSHGHMDIGTFVLDAKGVRWAEDLGAPDYYHYESRDVDIWNLRSSDGRWSVLAISPQVHNILTIGENSQVPDGLGSFIRFSATGHCSVLDLTPVYQNQASRVLRGVALLSDESVLLQDELQGLTPHANVTWRMLTRADIVLEEKGAVLQRRGQSLRLSFQAPADLALSVVEVDALRAPYDQFYPGYRLLEGRCKSSATGSLCLKALLQSNPRKNENPCFPLGSCEIWPDSTP